MSAPRATQPLGPVTQAVVLEAAPATPRGARREVAGLRRALSAPSLMTPDVPLTAGPMPRVVPRMPDGLGRGPPESDTEVHVNIGRIEITAVHEAPAARPRPKPADRLMSLEQYLARRDGRP